MELRLHEKAKKGNSLCQQTIFLIIEPITERRVNAGTTATGQRGTVREVSMSRGAWAEEIRQPRRASERCRGEEKTVPGVRTGVKSVESVSRERRGE